MKAFHAFIEGEVQGVGFRYAAVRQARALGLCGWVRNTQDGEVEVWAQGAQGDLDQFVEWLRQGPIYASVTNLRLSWQAPEVRYSSFEIAF